MATFVKGTCAVCGEVTFDVERISLIAYTAQPARFCLWRCPRCDEPRLQPIDAKVRDQLRAVGARLFVMPAGQRKTGPLRLDYMIDINDDLEQL